MPNNIQGAGSKNCGARLYSKTHNRWAAKVGTAASTIPAAETLTAPASWTSACDKRCCATLQHPTSHPACTHRTPQINI